MHLTVFYEIWNRDRCRRILRVISFLETSAGNKELCWQDEYICLEIFYIIDPQFSLNVSFLSDLDNNTARLKSCDCIWHAYNITDQ